jgi:hypothetical protein
MSGKNEYIAALEAQNRDLKAKLEEMACQLEEARMMGKLFNLSVEWNKEVKEPETFCQYGGV